MGKARDQDSYGRNGISWPQHMSRWFFLKKCVLEGRYVLMALSTNEEEVDGYI